MAIPGCSAVCAAHLVGQTAGASRATEAPPKRAAGPTVPRPRGKAEAFVKIIINEWAYATAYPNNAERAEDLDPFLRYYNLNRPHGGIGGNTPISRVH